MAIDRIGKGGAPPTPETPDTKAATVQPAERKFEVDPTRRAGAVEEAAATTPLARLRAGAIDVHAYIDLKVDEATAGLEGLSTAELDDIKHTLRDQMRSDPDLVDLVRAATGATPAPPED